jgi:hypothetical protein
MRETQASISEWATTTFGADGSDLIVASRANDEFAEFLRSYSKGKPDVVELADTAIVLVRLCERWGGQGDTVVTGTHLASDNLSELVVNAVEHMTTILVSSIDNIQRLLPLLEMLQTLAEIAIELGGNLCDEIDKKMVINRRREWTVVDGIGFHKHA